MRPGGFPYCRKNIRFLGASLHHRPSLHHVLGRLSSYGLRPFNYPILLTGRCTAGVGVGYALMIAPVYSAEISSPKSRGFITSLPELGISTGILTGYLSNYFTATLPLKLGWRLMLSIAAVPSLGLAIGILKMPESPRWLVMRGRLGEAKRIL